MLRNDHLKAGVLDMEIWLSELVSSDQWECGGSHEHSLTHWNSQLDGKSFNQNVDIIVFLAALAQLSRKNRGHLKVKSQLDHE